MLNCDQVSLSLQALFTLLFKVDLVQYLFLSMVSGLRSVRNAYLNILCAKYIQMLRKILDVFVLQYSVITKQFYTLPRSILICNCFDRSDHVSFMSCSFNCHHME